MLKPITEYTIEEAHFSADYRDCVAFLENVTNADIVTQKIRFGQIYVARIGKELVGVLELEFLWQQLPLIYNLIVHEKHRGMGISKALLAHIMKRSNPSKSPYLYSSSKQNHIEANTWHTRMGFEKCGVIESATPDANDNILFFRKAVKQDA